MTKRNLIIVILGLLLANFVAWVPNTLARRGDVWSQLDTLDIRHEIVSEYVEEPDERKMIESAVEGMIGALEDPYTAYLSPTDLQNFDKQVRGSFSGIGAEIALDDDGRLKIVSPLEDSPAWNAGVLAGDLVLEIDGESAEGVTIFEAVERLTGPEGTDVTIKVLHESGDEEVITITRARINIQTVRGLRRGADQHWDFMLDDENKVGYVRLTQFSDRTAADLREALDRLVEAGVRGLILDLRFNGGGLLESAREISDFFLEGGQTIVSVKGRNVEESVMKSTSDGTIKDVPLVVLANEASASASEIVTGALSDNGRARFIGTRTFGKGSVQQVKMLDGGQGAIKITNAYYYLPNGRNIHRREGQDVWGVDPDEGFYVPMSVEQIREMVKIRREGEIVKQRGGDEDQAPATPQWIDEELADPQLAAGLRAVLGYLEAGQWPKVGESTKEELVKLVKRRNLTRQRDLLKQRLVEVETELGALDGPDDEETKEPPRAQGDPQDNGEAAPDEGEAKKQLEGAGKP